MDTTLRAAERIIALLRDHEAELRAAGIRRLSLFGSVARDAAAPDSDIDLAAEPEPAAHIGLFGLAALERRLSGIVGGRVDLLAEPVGKERLRFAIERDRRRAF